MQHLARLLFALWLAPSSTALLLFNEVPWSNEENAEYGPVFEEQPEDTIYPEESPEGKISMSCRVRANPPAAYRWKLNSREINLQGESSRHFSLVGGNLVISRPNRTSHEGKYLCVANNTYGSVVSKEATIKFGYLDTFSVEEREAVYVREGQGVVLLCAPPPHYPDRLLFRWMFNEFPIFIPLDKRRFVSQTTGNLYISKVEATDTGNYSCFVSSPSISMSVFSKFIPLVPIAERPTRKYPADIRVKFSDTHALVGQNITLECFALGNPIPEIHWKKSNGELPRNHEIGMSGALLHLINVQVEDEGIYECEALNSKRSKDRHSARLHVDAYPEWTEHISSMEVDIGSSLTLSCAASGKPKPVIHWLKNGHPLNKEDVMFEKLVLNNSGMYQCIAENEHGAIYANAELRVIACAPTFEKNPVRRKMLAPKNGRVVIECKPKAAPRPRISWSKGTELLSNTTRIHIWEDGSLEILNVTKADEGKYTCFADNGRGKANSTGSLSITEATKITLAPSSADVQVGEGTHMQCAASHDPSLDITFIWSLNSLVIEFDRNGPHYELVSRDSNSELRIRNTQLKHAGRYSCTAQTIVDNVTVSADLVVRGPPGPPGGVRVEEIRDKLVKLLWSRGTDNHSPISRYTIQSRDAFSPDPEEWRNASTVPSNVEGNSESAVVTDLIPWTQYEFRVIATNTLGTGEPSVPSHKITTLEAVPVVAPSDIGGGGGSSRELTITWTPVKQQYHYGRDFGYIVAFKPNGDHEWRKVTVADPKAQHYVHKDTSIPADTEFLVKVKAFNSMGEGPYSLTASIRSAMDVPSEAPADVIGRALSATEARVWWLPSSQHNIDGYEVRYWRKNEESELLGQHVRVSKVENQTRLEKLQPNSHYMIEVRAINSAGRGPASKQIEIYTKKSPPSRAPKIIKKGLNVGGTRLNIEWENVVPLANESPVSGYKVIYRHADDPKGTLYTTVQHSIDLPLKKKGEYVVEVRAHSEGGDGAVTRVHISGGAVLAAQSFSLGSLLLLVLCCLLF